jgi:hypothetical protein
MGSAGGEILEFRPHGASKETAPIEITYFDDRPLRDSGFGVRWLRYRGHTYALTFASESLRRLRHLSLIDAKNREHLLCSFTVEEHESLTPASHADMPLCRAVAANDIQYLAVDRDPASTLEYSGERRFGTSIVGTTRADVTNSGTQDTLVQLDAGYAGARGWSARYYDLVSNGKIVSDGRLHKLLMVLQYIQEVPGSYSNFEEPGVADENRTSLFTYNGLTYIDVAASGGDSCNDTPFHEVRLLHDDRIETECAASFQITWKIHSIAQEYRR